MCYSSDLLRKIGKDARIKLGKQPLLQQHTRAGIIALGIKNNHIITLIEGLDVAGGFSIRLKVLYPVPDEQKPNKRNKSKAPYTCPTD